MTKLDLPRLRALEAAATPGPWTAPKGPITPQFASGRTDTFCVVTTAVGSSEEWWDEIWVHRRPADAALIAEARNSLKPLIEEVERRDKALETLKAGIKNELDLVDESAPFEAGAAAAYNHVLALLEAEPAAVSEEVT